MHITENQYINSLNSHINAIKHMHNLKVNFQKMLQITNSMLKQEMNQDGNLHFYPRKPKLSDTEIIAL
jgi:hypothetical protein